MTKPSLEELLRSRRSVRSFSAERPSDDVLERLVELATLAPSASNKQPWRFLIVTSRPVIEKMASVVREATDAVAAHVMPESQVAFRNYGDYFTRFESAPAVIVPIFRGHTVLSHLVDAGLDPELRDAIAVMERDSGLTGTALALMNLLLATHELGLGASAMTGPLLATRRLREILTVPESWGIVALVPVGHPAEAPQPTERKPLQKVIRWIR
jgi:nitroreductase